MKAIRLAAFGAPDALQAVDSPTPEPRPDQMLVRVAGCGVCGHDLLNRAGHFPHTPLPCVMGHEVAGEVVEVGSLITRFRVGDRVAMIQRIGCGTCIACRNGQENICTSGPGFYGEQISGGYGEYVVASEMNTLHLPDAIPMDVAPVLSCAIGTGYHALRRAALPIGSSVLITGASGGVGIHAVQLATLAGLEVIGVTTSPAKAAELKTAGAHHVVFAGEGGGFHKEVRDITDGVGVDCVLEIAGTPTFPSSVRALRAGGRMVVVGNVDPGNWPFNPALSILKELEFIGSAHATLNDLRKVIRIVADGKVRPQIGRVMPVAQAAEAHRAMEAKEITGRVVLMHEHAMAA
ncbi:MAG: alcohol dehydrogenase catalytic domain-containing protein [Novosphingobium sp.]|nr:alcohol dehydrogenase catalytic domain-containing protein [Novosphingobium sp.]